MVAEFRLEKPNMSYVNITAANTTMADQQGNNTSTTRNSIRGQILRGGDNTLLAGMLEADPNLRPVVMGGPGMHHDQLEQAQQQRQYYEGSPAPYQPPSSEGMAPVPEASAAEHPGDRGMGRYNYDAHGGMPSLGGDPQYMDGGLPRSASAGSQPVSSPPNQNILTRNFSASEQFNIPVPGNFNMHSPYGSRVTIIRATETIELVPHPNVSSQQQMQADFNGAKHSANSPQFPPNMPQVGASYPGEGEAGVGAMPRRASAQRLHRPMMPQDAAGLGGRQPTSPYGSHPNGAGDDPNMVQALLRSHESLKRENENLKRKLSVLVRTFNDEEKVIKVMKCLEEKKRAARNLR